jgi:endoglucanase
MLRTDGRKIVDGGGSQVMLRGYNIGSWMMMENFMLGTPGVEQHLRKYLREYAGEEKASRFFESFLNTFIQEKDIRFLKEIGCDHVRIPFNYRHFESGGGPLSFKPEGFAHLDRVIGYCRRHGLYAVLDLHAAPGYQNADWHSDNFTNRTGLFDNGFNQRRLAGLWRFIADHYKDDETVAGYGIMNEPVCRGEAGTAALNKAYRSAGEAIREADSRHILFIEGNLWGRSFAGFDEPWDGSVVCSVHYYTQPGLFNMGYPGWNDSEVYMDRGYLAQQMAPRDDYARRHGLPVWVSEFGLIYSEKHNEDKMRVLADQFSVFRELGYGWAQWSYKDAGSMGVVYFDPKGKWMELIGGVIKKKRRYRADFDPMEGGAWDMMDALRPFLRGGFADPAAVEERVKRQLSAVLAEELCKDFCRQLADMDQRDIDGLMSSFDLDNCLVRNDWKQLISENLEVIKPDT